MKNRILPILSLILVLAMLVTACSSGNQNNQTSPTTAPTQGGGPLAGVTLPATSPATAISAAPTTAVTTTTTTASATTAVTATAATTSTTAALPATGGCAIAPESGASITFSGWGDPTEQKVYRDSIARFEQACPGVKVNYVPVPTNFQDKMKAQMAGGSAPDVFYVDAQLMGAFAPSGQLMALDDMMQQANIKTSDFIPSLMKEFAYQGKTYGLPKDWGTLGLVYLPAAFQQAGIAEPTDNWTWDDMHKAAQAIAAKGKYAGYCQAADEARFGPFVFSYGGSYTSPDFKTATLNTPEVQQAATLQQSMVTDGSLKTPSDLGASWCGEAIGKQLVGMTLEGGWMVNFMKQTYPNVQYKAVEIPAGPKTRADYIFTNALGVNASTKFPKASFDLAAFITGRFNQGEIAKTGFAYSTHPDQANLLTNPIDQAIAKGGLLPDSKAQYWGLNTGKVEDAVSKALERVFLKQQSVQDSFNQGQNDAQSALGQ